MAKKKSVYKSAPEGAEDLSDKMSEKLFGGAKSSPKAKAKPPKAKAK